MTMKPTGVNWAQEVVVAMGIVVLLSPPMIFAIGIFLWATGTVGR